MIKFVRTRLFVPGFTWTRNRYAARGWLRKQAVSVLPVSTMAMMAGLNLMSAPVHAGGIVINKAETRLVEKVYQLSADIDYTFSDDVLSAIRNGVPITVAIAIRIVRPRRYLWDSEVATLTQRYQIQFHALAEQYIVHNLNSGGQSTYPTFHIAVSSFKDLVNLPLIDNNLLDASRTYIAEIRAYLELAALPAPLRLNAYISNSWRLSSEWYAWNLVTNNPVRTKP